MNREFWDHVGQFLTYTKHHTSYIEKEIVFGVFCHKIAIISVGYKSLLQIIYLKIYFQVGYMEERFGSTKSFIPSIRHVQ